VVTIGVILQWWRWASIGSELCIYRFVGGCGFVGAVALGGLVLMVVDCWCGDSRWVGLLWICWCSGPLVFWVVGRRLWVVICVLSVSFPVGMVGCEDVFEISGECDLLLGLDCGGGSMVVRGGLVERGVPVIKCKIINNNNNNNNK
jgi:hypothetical protein